MLLDLYNNIQFIPPFLFTLAILSKCYIGCKFKICIPKKNKDDILLDYIFPN